MSEEKRSNWPFVNWDNTYRDMQPFEKKYPPASFPEAAFSPPLKAKRFSEDATLPTRANPTDAGIDLYSAEDLLILPGKYRVIDTDVGFALREGTYGKIEGRSSLAINGIFPIGGVIDAGYRGKIKVALVNMADEPYSIRTGDKIAQLVVVKIETPAVVEVNEFSDTTDRGEKGFGSSGK